MTPDPKHPELDDVPTPAPGWLPDSDDDAMPDEESHEIPKHNPKHAPSPLPLPAD